MTTYFLSVEGGPKSYQWTPFEAETFKAAKTECARLFGNGYSPLEVTFLIAIETAHNKKTIIAARSISDRAWKHYIGYNDATLKEVNELIKIRSY